jgi:hypothetical protein
MDNVSRVTRYSQATVTFGDSAEAHHANHCLRTRAAVLCRTFLHTAGLEWASVPDEIGHVLYTATLKQHKNIKK